MNDTAKAERGSWSSVWRPLRISIFRNLLIANLVSDIGTFMQNVGTAWLMVSSGAGPAYVALTQTASSLPFFLFAPVTGAGHDLALRRLETAGAQLTSWIEVLLEFQRDWTRKDTHEGARSIVVDHGGGYGIGLAYAREMIHPPQKLIKSATRGERNPSNHLRDEERCSRNAKTDPKIRYGGSCGQN